MAISTEIDYSKDLAALFEKRSGYNFRAIMKIKKICLFNEIFMLQKFGAIRYNATTVVCPNKLNNNTAQIFTICHT